MTGGGYRVLHVIESLHRGAVENWLLRMLGHARTRGIELPWTFYAALPGAGERDEAARSLGARVVASPVPLGRKSHFVAALRAELRSGKYDVLHCHHDLTSAVYLAASTGLAIRRRLVHVHNAGEALPTPSLLKQRLLREPMRRFCLWSADRIVGISNVTLDTFIGGRARRSGRDRVHYYGVDTTAFERLAPDPKEFRRQLGLPQESLALLFAGRVTYEKNARFLVDVVAELRRAGKPFVGIFAGSGPAEPDVAQRARELRVTEAVRMLGWRSDIPQIMACCDYFMLAPIERPMEGFGLAVVEAQLAGLRLLLSMGIPDDPLLPGAVFERLRLSAGAGAWAEAAIAMLERPPLRRQQALAALRQSPMDMDFALRDLLELYE